MENIKQKVKCPNCDCQVKLVITEFGGKVVVEQPDGSPYIDKKDLADHYKKVKGFTEAAGAAWDQEHRLRAFHHAKKILVAIPVVETAKRSIGWTADEYRRRGLGTNGWNLATVEKWAAEFLVDEARRSARAGLPKCCECGNAAIKDTKVCKEHSWCYLCDDKGRDSQKMPEDMIPQKNTPPICRDCQIQKEKTT